MELLLLLALILLNGVFAMSEMALVSSRTARLQQRAEAGSAGARAALKLSSDPSVFLSTVQVGITTIGILSGAFGENAIAEKLILVFNDWPLLEPYSKGLATAIMVITVTYCSVVLGEIVPKRLALLNPERVASFVAPPMTVVARLAHPLVSLFSLSSNALLRLLGARPNNEPGVSEDEIRMMLAQGAAEGVFHRSEAAMVGNVFRLDDLQVTAIMTPRPDIRWLDLDDSLEENHAVLREGRFQTLPVCRGSLDEIVGLLDAKHYLALCLQNTAPALEDALHAAVFVPETVSPNQLLETLKRKHSHLALVVDEYGSIEGMVSLTDLLEAIVGDLPDRSSDAANAAVQRADGSWLLDGMLALDRVSQLLELRDGLDNPSASYHTLGGLVMDQLGRVPEVGASFEFRGIRFEVMDMDGNRVDRVLASHHVSSAVVGDFDC